LELAMDSTIQKDTILEDNDFKVDVFADPALALENFKANLYEMFIVGTYMSKVNSWQLYNEINKIDDKARVFFLIIRKR
jgi:DNA-binding response OmpR family regulator